jgi:hypothetical protein
MSVCLFVGPTLRREEIAAIFDADCQPPVGQGDVYRAAQRGVRAIGIIDGFFNGAPSVWHKEILWALSQGIYVFGSASMGALRAAELHTFGMRGVGRIFEAFRDGTLEDDDEVAIVHGPAELGYVAASEPMVNIRATLARATADRVVSDSSRRVLESFGKSLFYPHRSWAAIVESAPAQGIGEGEVAALRAWLPHGRVDLKREDALAMLEAIKHALARSDPVRCDWKFEWTHLWDELVAGLATDSTTGQTASPVSYRFVIEELRLEGESTYGRVKTGALLRLFAGIEARRRGVEATPEAVRAALSRMRETLGLFNRAQLESWLARNHLGIADLERLIQDQARAGAVAGLSGPSLDRHLIDELRLTGSYEPLVARAQRKGEVLASHGIDGVDAGVPGPTTVELRFWYFQQYLKQPVPDDFAAYARELGFADIEEFDGAVRREWIYSRNNA